MDTLEYSEFYAYSNVSRFRLLFYCSLYHNRINIQIETKIRVKIGVYSHINQMVLSTKLFSNSECIGICIGIILIFLFLIFEKSFIVHIFLIF